MDHRWDNEIARRLGDELDQLVYLSNLIGSDPTLTQPGGGNSSVKRVEADLAGRDVEVLRVKGSGTDLASIRRPGFAGLRLGDLSVIGARAEMSDEEMMALLRAGMLDTREPAPSVETPLHSMLPHRFIVHTHDFATQALTDTERPEANVGEALGREAVYVDYVRPGFPLARAVARLGGLARLGDGARGLVLGRHGLVAWGDSARACYDNLHFLINRAETFIADRRRGEGGAGAMARPFAAAGAAPLSPEHRRAVARAVLPVLRRKLSASRPVVLHYDDSAEALAFVGDPRARDLAARGMSTPEHILRCGSLPLFVDQDFLGAAVPAPGAGADVAGVVGAAVDGFTARHSAAVARHRPDPQEGPGALDVGPRVVLLPGLGIVTAMKDKANAVVGNLCYRHVTRVMAASEALGGFRFLDEGDALEFEYWPLELAKLQQPERELARKVALVTGAASGIGRAIAERLVAEQAHVVLTDVRPDALAAVAAEIAARYKDRERVRAVVADSSKAEDAARAVGEAVLAYGGLDILVANAGILEPGPIDKIDEQSWDRTYDVNVKGTFLAVREAVKVMKAGGGGVILLNASKAAFAPTVNNAAYASAKAAVGALGRNLATELGPFGIRVNCINADFVDTPLMRAMIAERAAMAGISVAEQEAAYRARNLLHVGPIPAEAVAEAALYLVSPRSRYTTGAALPVDGGIKEAMPR